jgi:hypothetical protein
MEFKEFATLIDGFIPGGVAEYQRKKRAEADREMLELAQRHKSDRRTLVEELAEQDAVVEKARLDDAKKRELSAASSARHAAEVRKRQGKQAQIDAADREYARRARALEPKDLFRRFRAEIEDLIEKAVPPFANIEVRNGMGELRVQPVAGDATERRRALFRLRQALQNDWYLEPLDQQGFEHKFAEAVAALPPIQPPPTAAEFMARQRGAA